MEEWANVRHFVVPVLAEPRSGSEQVTQAIAGDPVRLLESRDGWTRIRMQDEYEGWSRSHHLQPCTGTGLFTDRQSPELLVRVKAPFADLRGPEGSLLCRIPYWTPLALSALPAEGSTHVPVTAPGGQLGSVSQSCIQPFDSRCADAAAIGALACEFLGTPYLWGGTTPFGFDCSGLVQRVYMASGLCIPRDAYMQAHSPFGRALSEGAAYSGGDLIFFSGNSDPRNRGITHVGMMLDHVRMVHASSDWGVVIQQIDDPEILRKYAIHSAWRAGEPGCTPN